MVGALPSSVRYVKNGSGGKWWKTAKADGQIHAGWSNVQEALLINPGDFSAIQQAISSDESGSQDAGARKRDFNQLRDLLDKPSRHIWITFEDGCMWWCTVKDGAAVNPPTGSQAAGHFWLTCDLPWSNKSLQGRLLSISGLPGMVVRASGFRGTVCEPRAAKAILRIIRDEVDADAHAAALAREAYERAVSKLVSRMGDKDFEVLVDLILSRTGWARLAKLGRVTEGIDIEVENAASDEIAFVQVKSSATQATLDDYVSKFNERRDRYHRMIFAVHSPEGNVTPPSGLPIQVWTGEKIANLVVKLGLSDWVANRL
jgi:hypothetical protein